MSLHQQMAKNGNDILCTTQTEFIFGETAYVTFHLPADLAKLCEEKPILACMNRDLEWVDPPKLSDDDKFDPSALGGEWQFRSTAIFTDDYRRTQIGIRRELEAKKERERLLEEKKREAEAMKKAIERELRLMAGEGGSSPSGEEGTKVPINISPFQRTFSWVGGSAPGGWEFHGHTGVSRSSVLYCHRPTDSTQHQHRGPDAHNYDAHGMQCQSPHNYTGPDQSSVKFRVAVGVTPVWPKFNGRPSNTVDRSLSQKSRGERRRRRWCRRSRSHRRSRIARSSNGSRSREKSGATGRCASR